MTLLRTVEFGLYSGTARGTHSPPAMTLRIFSKIRPARVKADKPNYRCVSIGSQKPIVAVVQGAAIGGGATRLTHCDFVYAGEPAKFQMPFINLGLVPEFGSSFSVPARTGHLRAAELVLLGEPFDARRAAELGLVTRVVPDKDLMATATATAQKLAAKPIGTLRAPSASIKQSSMATQRGCESRKPGIRRAIGVGRSQGSVICFLGEASAQFRKDSRPLAVE